MSLPSKIGELRSVIDQENDDIDQETEASIRLSGKLNSVEKHSELLNLKSELIRTGYGELVVESDFLGEVNLQECQPEDLCEYGFTLYLNKKAKTEGHFWFSNVLALYKCEETFWHRANHVENFEEFDPFSSYTTVFTQYKRGVEFEKCEWNGEVDARSIVRVRCNRLEVPRDIRPWLLCRTSSPSRVIAVWRDIAVRKLLYIWCDEVTDDVDQAFCVLQSPQRKSIQVDNVVSGNLETLYKTFEGSAVWIFGSRSDAPARHALLTHYLNIEWPSGVDWVQEIGDVLPRALDNAKNAYRLHVVESSGSTQTERSQ